MKFVLVVPSVVEPMIAITIRSSMRVTMKFVLVVPSVVEGPGRGASP